MKVRVRYEDGEYWLVPYVQAHAEKKLAFVEVDDLTWALYQAHEKADSVWQQHISKLDNEQYEKDHPV